LEGGRLREKHHIPLTTIRWVRFPSSADRWYPSIPSVKKPYSTNKSKNGYIPIIEIIEIIVFIQRY